MGKHSNLWGEISNSEWKQSIVLSSVPLWKYNDQNVPIANASGCLIDYLGCRFLLSIAHSSIAKDVWHFEVASLHIYENGEKGTCIQPFQMDWLEEFSLIEETYELTESKLVDFTYKKIRSDLGSHHGLCFTQDDQILGADRTVFKPDFNIKPSNNINYGFYGQVRFKGVSGNKILFDYQLEDKLSYIGKEGDLFVFKLPHPYGSHANYQGCSGAPIIDENGNLVSLVSFGRKSTNCIYGIDINRYRAALDIEAGPSLERKK